MMEISEDSQKENSNKKDTQSQNIFVSIVEEVYPQRSLLVLSKGMRSPHLMAHLIGKYAKERDYSLTLLLNFKKEEVPAVNDQLDALYFGKYKIKPITNETTAKRTMLYTSGGIYTITNVILVMDLLQKAISPSIITTVIFNEAEKIDNVLNDEPWIATMIRKENKNVKTLAITDNIEVLVSNQGFRKAMQGLYLEYCSVWPLSRYEILKDFTEHPDFETFENNIHLPAPIKRLQKAIMTVTRSCIEEFNRRYKERNKGEDVINELDVFNTSLNVVFYRLKAIAGRFNLHGQQLLRDIYEFRMLLLHVIYSDAAEFYLKVLTLKNSANFESIWYIGDNKTMNYIEELLDLSKQRVFKLKRDVLIDDNNNLNRVSSLGDIDGLEEEMSSATNTVSLSRYESFMNENKEDENNLLDVVKNPITVKGKAYRLDLKINLNFKYKALIEIVKKITKQHKNPDNKDQKGRNNTKKTIWIWTQDEKKVDKIKDVLTSFFAKKDEHKLKLLLRLQHLLSEMGVYKKDSITGEIIEEESDDDEEQFRNSNSNNNKMRRKPKNDEKEIERTIYKRLNRDLLHLKREYEKKVMINLFNNDNPNYSLDPIVSQPIASQNAQQSNLEVEENKTDLTLGSQSKNSLKRRYYDLDGDIEEEKTDQEPERIEIEKEINVESNKEMEIISKKELEEFEDDFDWELLEELDKQEFSIKKPLTEDSEKNKKKQRVYQYAILNPEKIDLNSFYKYSDSGRVIFDTELVPGYKIIVNCLGSTSERVSFINKTQPDIAVMFEPQLSLIREIMLEKRCSKLEKDRCKISEVHILMVQNSIESAIYLDNVRKENSAFVTLLNERSSLPVLDDNPESRIKRIVYQKNMSTRIGKGLGFSASLGNKPIIIVDKREFNSPVPTKLYHDGFWIIPILLEKGDYVLTNSIVVERKCVETGDLLNSFRSGRLENQIKNLCATYSKPMLLIEFSEGVDFSLESAEINRLQHNINWVNDFESDKREINKSNVKYGLSLLCMKYPKLTILWSKSPEYTSKLFQKLREQTSDPNPRDFALYQEESEKNNESDPYVRHANNETENPDLTNLI